jgi:hypothetical protein
MTSPAVKPLIVAVGIAERRISSVPLPVNTIQHQRFRKRHSHLRHQTKNLRATVSDKGRDARELGLAKTCMKLK